MEWSEFSKLIVATLVGAIIPRFFKSSDKQRDQEIRIAVMAENQKHDQEELIIVKRDQKTLWREFDKLRGKI